MHRQNLFKSITLLFLTFLLTFSSPFSYFLSGKVNAASTDGTAGNVHVTPNNFLNYFTLNGNASYDSTSGIVTLTPNERSKSGNFTLNNKIDVNRNFTLKGEINLGDKAQSKGGADGIGFAFHPGQTSQVGNTGAAIGIGGLSNAFGFKFDTFSNRVADNNVNANADPTAFFSKSYGAFAYTNDAGRVTTYSGSDAPAQSISDPSNNQFKPVQFDYNGEKKVMTITYDGKTWTKNIEDWIIDDISAYAFAVSASTGTNYNLQQFKITSFDYVTTGKVIVKYIDIETGKELENNTELEGSINDTYTTEQKDFDGYKFVKVAGEKQGTFQESSVPETIYYYQKIPTVGSVELTKVDKEDANKLLSGAEFKLLDSDKQVVKENLTTASNGKIKISDLALGKYSLIETKAPDGYQLDTTPVTFEITEENAAKTLELKKENQKAPPLTGSVSLTKTDADNTNKTLAGAEFNLLDGDGNIIKDNLTTDQNGELHVEKLSLGSYQLIETKAPTNYILDTTPVKFTITKDNYQSPISLTKENTEMKGSVSLTKTDADNTNKTLAGAEFNLLDGDGNIIKDNLTTDQNGELHVEKLSLGSYQLIETKAPTNYILDTTPVKFTITKDNYQSPISLTKETTEMKGSVSLTKTDADNTNKTLAGAEFKLLDGDGNIIKDNLTTDQNGELHVEKLSLGSYQLIETKAPTGYQLDQTPVDFTIKADNYQKNMELTKKNTKLAPKTASVELTKKAAGSKKVLQGATFKLTTANGKILQKELVTDQNGKLKIKDLPLGTYQLVETKAPIGYQLNDTPVKFTLTSDNHVKPLKVTKTNQLLPASEASVLLTKVASENKNKTLAGAEFKLINAENKVIQTHLKTNQAGTILVKKLPAGSYHFVETKAPTNYQLSKKAINFTVKSHASKVIQVTAENKQATPPTIVKNINNKSHITLANRDQPFNWNIIANFGNGTSDWKQAAIQDKVKNVFDIEKITILDENGHDVKANGKITIKNNLVTFHIAKKDGSFAYLANHTYKMTITTKIKSSISNQKLVKLSKHGGIPNIANLTYYHNGKITIHSNEPRVTPPSITTISLPKTGDTSLLTWVILGILFVISSFLLLFTKKRRKHT